VEAEIEFPSLAGIGDVRGRIMGPSCAYTTTIEVAYRVRGNRVIIPEPAWWDPQSPFLYRGPVEVWQGGELIESEQVRIGLRHTMIEGEQIIHNGRPIELKSKKIESADDTMLRKLRAAGFNAVEVPAPIADQACEIADRVGLFVINNDEITIDPLRHPSAIRR
jgi:beta-galactosidase